MHVFESYASEKVLGIMRQMETNKEFYMGRLLHSSKVQTQLPKFVISMNLHDFYFMLRMGYETL